MPTTFSYPPSCFDRATGKDGQPGTETPPTAVFVTAANGAQSINDIQLEELPNSPQIERAEQCTIRHQFKLPYFNAIILQGGLGRGVFLVDSFGNVSRIVSSSVETLMPDYAILTVVAESISFDTPPDEFNIVPEQIGVWIVKHPRYWYAIQALKDPFSLIAIINSYTDTTFIQGKQSTFLMIDQWSDGSDPAVLALAQAAAKEIIAKMNLGIDVPYLPGWRLTWAQYFWITPYMNCGAYLQDPILEGGLPSFFWSTDGTSSLTSTIFSKMALQNPQCYLTPTGALQISWLRQADEMEYNRTWFKLTRTWIGSPIGHWDEDIYTKSPRPNNPNQYHF